MNLDEARKQLKKIGLPTQFYIPDEYKYCELCGNLTSINDVNIHKDGYEKTTGNANYSGDITIGCDKCSWKTTDRIMLSRLTKPEWYIFSRNSGLVQGGGGCLISIVTFALSLVGLIGLMVFLAV